MGTRYYRNNLKYDKLLLSELMEYGYICSHFECKETVEGPIVCKHSIYVIQHDTTKDLYYIRYYDDKVVEFKKLND